MEDLKKKEEEEEQGKKKEEEEEEEKEDKEEDNSSCVWKKFNHKELEAQYSPSRWSRKHGEAEVIPLHVEEARRRSDVARGGVPCRQDVVYGDPSWRRGRADLYGEDLPGAAPVLVYVHGGYWQQLEKHVSAYLVPPLYRAGVVVVVAGYDLAPAVGVADIVKEVRAGVAWACGLARGRGSVGVILAGWSAGGHLVTQALSEEGQEGQLSVTCRDLIRGVVTLSGVFDLRPLVTTYVNDPLQLTPESAWALSPLRCVGGLARAGAGAASLKVMVVVGEQDSPEFIRQSKQYYEACVNVGIPAQLTIMEDCDHFSLVCDLFLDQFPLTRRLQAFVHSCCGSRKEEEEEVKEEEEEEEEVKEEEEEG